MTLLQLQYFQALAHNLHYTRTAQELHISQPSLSYAIAELEKELGVKLFKKEKKSIVLTVYGQQFLPYVEKSLTLLDDGRNLLEQMAGEMDYVVHLGYFHSISASLIPSIVEHFYLNGDNRHIRFHFTEGPSYDIFNRIQQGKLDFGFSLHQGDWAQSIPILRQPLYLAVPCNHPLAKYRSVRFQQFSSEPQIMLEHGSNLRSNMDQIFAQCNTIPNIVFEVRECNAALQYVGLGFGVSVLPYVPAMESDKVAILPITDHEQEFIRTVYFLFHKNRPISPAAQKVRDYIIEHFSIDANAKTTP